MDNRNENIENQNFLLELLQLINRENFINRETRQQRTFFNNRRNTNDFQNVNQQQNNRYQSPESVYRQQIVDIISQYNNNVHEYQAMMRDYNEIIIYALEMLQVMRPNRNVSPGFGQQTNRNYLSNNYGFRGLYTPPRYSRPINIPAFTNIFSEPVIVHPSNEQITNATRTFNYVIDTSTNTRCPITLEEFQHNDVVCEIKHCRHLFKKESIMDWFQRNVRCPVCRYDIREYLEQETSEEDEEEEESTENTNIENIDNNLSDSGIFYMDLSNNISRTSTPIRRQGSPNLNTVLINSVNNQINTIATNISNILHNYIQQETVENNDISSNIFTFEIPIIYFDLSNSRV
jgi:hypothetical protein